MKHLEHCIPWKNVPNITPHYLSTMGQPLKSDSKMWVLTVRLDLLWKVHMLLQVSICGVQTLFTGPLDGAASTLIYICIWFATYSLRVRTAWFILPQPHWSIRQPLPAVASCPVTHSNQLAMACLSISA